MTRPQLELFLITYNRQEKCRQTLDVILGENSPVKDVPFTILDNCSTDGTSEMLAELAHKYPHIRYIRHPKNIGGNANIARAFEMATAEYVWVLCDDDKYDFSGWKECEKALSENPPAVVVANYGNPQKSPAHLFRQLSFVPAAIYRTDLITETVLVNMYFNLGNMFPQLAIAAAVMNIQLSIPILELPLVTMQLNPNNDSTVRGICTTQRIHPLIKEMFWSLGYLRSIQMLADKKLRAACSSLAWAEDYTSFYYFCKIWRAITHKNVWTNYFEALHLLSGYPKIKFAFFIPLSYFVFFYTTEKDVRICLFGKIKIRIWKFLKPKKN